MKSVFQILIEFACLLIYVVPSWHTWMILEHIVLQFNVLNGLSMILKMLILVNNQIRMKILMKILKILRQLIQMKLHLIHLLFQKINYILIHLMIGIGKNVIVSIQIHMNRLVISLWLLNQIVHVLMEDRVDYFKIFIARKMMLLLLEIFMKLDQVTCSFLMGFVFRQIEYV